jgi:hypothetical protein
MLVRSTSPVGTGTLLSLFKPKPDIGNLRVWVLV